MSVRSGPMRGLNLNVSEHTLSSHISGTYEQRVQTAIDECVKPRDVCYDLGASIGYFTMLMARKAQWVYAFEPAPHATEEIRKNRVVQGALKLILEPIFEADFQSGSYGYRPKRTAHEAVNRVAQAIAEEKTRIIDIDLSAYFDNVQHSLLLEKVAQRIKDGEVMHLLKMIVKATGKKGVPQGGVVTPRTQKITSVLSAC
jgi:tRNA G37 N-methylase Trm5